MLPGEGRPIRVTRTPQPEPLVIPEDMPAAPEPVREPAPVREPEPVKVGE